MKETKTLLVTAEIDDEFHYFTFPQGTKKSEIYRHLEDKYETQEIMVTQTEEIITFEHLAF